MTPPPAADPLKERARRNAERFRAEIVELSHSVHAEPELAFEEVKTARKLISLLQNHGFTVRQGVAEMPTAFVASYGSGPLVIGFCAELDALPAVGHACGHNIIAAAGALAGLTLASVASAADVTVQVFGTPAEEFGGGKIFMLDAGAFDGVHAAMMVHPGVQEFADHYTRAVTDLEVTYTGKEAHSAMAPEQGINAGDAATVAQVAIGLLRQHLNPGDLIHGVLTEAGQAPNVVPDTAHLLYDARASTLTGLEQVKRRLVKCFEAGAVATGCELEVKDQWPAFSEFVNDDFLVTAYRENAEALGRTFTDTPLPERMRQAGSTDMANVSKRIPAIHPTIRIAAGSSTNHQREFATYCISADADKAAFDGGLALALTGLDAALDASTRSRLLSGRNHESR